MRILPMVSIFALLSATHVAWAQDDTEGLIEKAIRAHGGEAALAKLNSVRIKVEGDAEFVPGQPPVPIVVEDVWQMPNCYKTTSHLAFQGQKVSQTLCINGDGWAQVNGRVQPFPPEGVKEMKEQLWAENFDRLLPLRDKSLKLTRISDSKVDDRPVAGIQLEAEGHRAVRLYFDKENGLLVRREHEVRGNAGRLVAQAVVFSGFEDKGGVKHWTKITAYRDGKRYITATLRELETNRKTDATEFAKPDEPHRRPSTLTAARPVIGSRHSSTIQRSSTRSRRRRSTTAPVESTANPQRGGEFNGICVIMQQDSGYQSRAGVAQCHRLNLPN